MSSAEQDSPIDPTGARVGTLTDADGIVVYTYTWAAKNPRAIIHLAHGVGEHARRYAALAEELVAAGYTVVADDHRGHGRTGLEAGGLADLGPGAVRGAIRSLRSVGESIAREYPGIPLVLLGHSWGSLMAQKLVNTTTIYDAVVLSGSSLAVPGVLNSGDLNKPWRGPESTGLEWLNRDPEAGAAFRADPLNFDIAEKPAWNLFQAIGLLGRPPRRMPRDIPMLIQGGSADSLGGERGLTKLDAAYRNRAKLSDVTLHVYPDARHEIYNELNREEIIADLVRWLDAHVPVAG
ncbi:alpha/beta hydrolase [Mycetocola lacteus]|uniref:Alpha/beta hydrolase n=1 Tax=Mycetocola lacteus TaxID=76637 RepID=A0A3L7AHI9_9MICO|nr:alpha/beta hydrolase [Mycetocola lacteus]RLP79405.1 alpha/beta hydrolase [Mycetocola lacteus]